MNVKEISIADYRITNLFEIDIDNDFIPVESLSGEFNTDDNNDITPSSLITIEDEEFELDENYDIMPKE